MRTFVFLLLTLVVVMRSSLISQNILSMNSAFVPKQMFLNKDRIVLLENNVLVALDNLEIKNIQLLNKNDDYSIDSSENCI